MHALTENPSEENMDRACRFGSEVLQTYPGSLPLNALHKLL